MGRQEKAGLTEQAMVRQVSRRERSGNSGVAVFIMILLWAGLVGGGFYVGKTYLDRSIEEIKQTNAMNIQVLTERIASLNTQIEELQQLIGSTDAALSSSGNIQMQLNSKIEMLTQQMSALEESLRILKEAPNAKN